MKAFQRISFSKMVSVVLIALTVINGNGGGILSYISYDIPSKLLTIERDLTEAFFVEINLHNKKKCLISCSYNPKRASIANHLLPLSKCTYTHL